ncbi:MAG: hypothetical protein ACLFNK_02980, partial [Candidatus Woesearchaeota archaeon]
NKGELNIFIKPVLCIDPKQLWAEDSLASRFARTFTKRSYKKEIKFHKDKMEELTFDFQEDIKKFLGLSTIKDFGEPFHPEKGLGWS